MIANDTKVLINITTGMIRINVMIRVIVMIMMIVTTITRNFKNFY